MNEVSKGSFAFSTIGMLSEHPPNQGFIDWFYMLLLPCKGKGNACTATHVCDGDLKSRDKGETSMPQESKELLRIQSMLEQLAFKAPLNPHAVADDQFHTV